MFYHPVLPNEILQQIKTYKFIKSLHVKCTLHTVNFNIIKIRDGLGALPYTT